MKNTKLSSWFCKLNIKMKYFLWKEFKLFPFSST